MVGLKQVCGIVLLVGVVWLTAFGCEEDIVIPGGYTVTGIVTLTGTMRDAQGNGVGTIEVAGADGVRVALMKNNNLVGFRLATAGEYEFSHVNNGTYSVTSTVDNVTFVPGPTFTVTDSDMVVSDTLRVPSNGTVSAYPNPFSANTVTLSVTLATPGHLGVNILGADQRIVRRLVSETKPAGAHTLVWDSRDDFGITVPDGAYWALVTAAGVIHYELIVKESPMFRGS